jgi:hypothetical protein
MFQAFQRDPAGDGEEQSEYGWNEGRPRLRPGDQVSPDAQQDKDNSKSEDDARHVHKLVNLGTFVPSAKARTGADGRHRTSLARVAGLVSVASGSSHANLENIPACFCPFSGRPAALG